MSTASAPTLLRRRGRAVTRRRLLGGCAGSITAGLLAGALSTLLGGGAALAKRGSSGGKIRHVDSGPQGWTLTLALDHAPFPKRASKYRDPTVIVFVPRYFRLPKSLRPDALVHFHGHNTTAAQAMKKHQLREQLFDSKQNAILIMPQGPVRAADSSAGEIDKRGGLQRLLRELVRVLRSRPANRTLGASSLAGAKRIGHLCLSAHSGGYRAVARCLTRGGREINEVYLFDALYGSVNSFYRWVVKTKGRKGRQRHKLISHYAGGSVRDNNLKLLARLQGAGVRCKHEKRLGRMSRAEMVRGAAVFIASPLDHGNVAVRHNNLRDCLFASGFKRHLKSGWFKNKTAPRQIDRRGDSP